VALGYDYDPFLEFTLDQMPREEFLALWHTHEAEIRREAERRRIDAPNPDEYRRDPCGATATKHGARSHPAPA